MNLDTFRAELVSGKIDAILNRMFDGAAIPWVFDDDATLYSDFQQAVREAVGVEGVDVFVVGSGRFGFSMKPNKIGVDFTYKSDVDVVLISASIFDMIWSAVVHDFFPRGVNIRFLRGWLGDLRNDIFTGWIQPATIRPPAWLITDGFKPTQSLRSNLFMAGRTLSANIPRQNKGIKFRIYRTLDFAVQYHRDGLSSTRQLILQEPVL